MLRITHCILGVLFSLLLFREISSRKSGFIIKRLVLLNYELGHSVIKLRMVLLILN